MEKKARVDTAVVIVLIILLIVLLVLAFLVLYKSSTATTEKKAGTSVSEENIQFVHKEQTINESCPYGICEQPLEKPKVSHGGGGGGGTIACTRDHDCGINHFIGNKACVDNNVTQQFVSYTCHHPGSKDSYCSDQTTTKTIEQCTGNFSCSDGECVQIRCFIDAQCNDNNPLTFDQCINPGQENSSCENILVECAQDSDCGDEGFIGTEYCSDNDIYHDFEIPMCLFPGLLNATCEFPTFPILKISCQYACLVGDCIRCTSNAECFDNNPFTDDICINPGTNISYCTSDPTQTCNPNQTVQCGYNNIGECKFGLRVCGEDGFWGVCEDAIFPTTEICDGKDNDCDGQIDEGCGPPTPQCRDGLDNDADGAADYPNDFSCSSSEDNDETYPKAQCQDGLDNDGDYMADLEDPSCTSFQDNLEAPVDLTQCADYIDNDADGKIDYPLDRQCTSYIDNNEGA